MGDCPCCQRWGTQKRRNSFHITTEHARSPVTNKIGHAQRWPRPWPRIETARPLVVEPPLDRLAANVESAEELKEHLLGAVDGIDGAAHALVADLCLDSLAVVADSDGLVAVGVAV